MCKKNIFPILFFLMGACVYNMQSQNSNDTIQEHSYCATCIASVDKDTSTAQTKRQGIYNSVEQMPKYPGGDRALMDFISQNIQYSADAMENRIQGRVIVRFVVTKDGSLSDITIIRSLYPSCDKEALRVINSMPNWIPGKQHGKNVDVYFTLPVFFRLPSEATEVNEIK